MEPQGVKVPVAPLKDCSDVGTHDERWAEWDDGNLRSYLQSQASNEKKQQMLAAARTRQELLMLAQQWQVSFMPKASWTAEGRGLGGVRRRIIDIWLEAEKGNLLSVQLYIDQGEDIERVKERRRTPLHCAVLGGHLPVVKLLLEKGANVHARDMDRETPLHMAAQRGNVLIVTALVDAGADKEAATDEGVKPGDHFDFGISTESRAEILRILGRKIKPHRSSSGSAARAATAADAKPRQACCAVS